MSEDQVGGYMVQMVDRILRRHAVGTIISSLEAHPQRLIIVPIDEGLGARRFLDGLATQLPAEDTQMVTVLPWDMNYPGALLTQLKDRPANAIVLIHDFDQADDTSFRELVTASKREGVRIVATVSSERLHVLADEIITLPPFTLPETDQFARALTGHKLPALLLEDLYFATRGRPDYVAEMLDVAPRDYWTQANAALTIPDSWHTEFNRRIQGLSPETIEALYVRPLVPEDLSEAISAGIVQLRKNEMGQETFFRDPRFNAITQASIPTPPRATTAIAREKLLLSKAQAHADDLGLGSAQLFLQDCTGVVNAEHRDTLTGYIALYTGNRHQAQAYLEPVTKSLEQSAAGSMFELANWNPRGLAARSQHTMSLAMPGSVRYEEARIHRSFAYWLINRTFPERNPELRHAVSRERLTMFSGWVALADDDPISAREQLRPVPGGALSVGIWRDALLARTLFVLGQWDEAKVVVERGLAACELHGVALLEPFLLWTGASIASMEGHQGLARSYVNRAAAGSDSFALQQIPAAMARLFVSSTLWDLNSAVSAADDLASAAKRADTYQPGFWPWEDVYAQTLLRSGRLDEADMVVTAAEERTADVDLVSWFARLAVPRATIMLQRGEVEPALRLFDDAVDAIEHSPMPVYATRVLFEYGITLRRIGRRSRADDILRRASTLFEELGAHVMVERCNKERRLSGVGGHVHSRLGLTAQEEQVARLAADGITNREIALQLTLSLKTVEYHLTNIYKKLGIKGRPELGAALK
ncbi:helix-turn-helix transcriptional regulator [Corynebacterium cystitidis]|uniref:helix-turn-helix transcriptional regulator n=1 Tax=Corynebacterium cystitidis TaxID=35757 RepID=UPI00211EBFB5|nr:helix-turn-helix transcriptional regulator [Corynebacterium cystitidis]